jgi:hypothetical protein
LIRPDGRTDRTPFGDVDRRSVPGRRIGAANTRHRRMPLQRQDAAQPRILASTDPLDNHG